MRKRSPFQKKHRITNETYEISEDVQEIYSFRCIPQIIGPILEVLLTTRQTVETEINSVTDNPIIDHTSKLFLHGGNFHGEYIAVAIDQLKAAITKLSMLSERRTNFFLHHRINRHFPPFLNMKKPGLTLGLQGLQFVATSTTSQNQSLAFPHHIHSIPTNGDNQDVVSMGTDAAQFAMKVIDNTYVVLAIELVALAQATDILGIRRRLSDPARNLYEKVRACIAPIKEDRVLIHELPELVTKIKTDPDLSLHWYLHKNMAL